MLAWLYCSRRWNCSLFITQCKNLNVKKKKKCLDNLSTVEKSSSVRYRTAMWRQHGQQLEWIIQLSRCPLMKWTSFSYNNNSTTHASQWPETNVCYAEWSVEESSQSVGGMHTGNDATTTSLIVLPSDTPNVSLSFTSKTCPGVIVADISEKEKTKEEKKERKRSSSLLCLSHFLFIIKVSQRTLGLHCSISIFTHKESLLCFVQCGEITAFLLHKWCLPIPTDFDCSQKFRIYSDARTAAWLPFPTSYYCI